MYCTCRYRSVNSELRFRVPEEHITVVANGFVIRNVDLRDVDNFLGSSNMQDVAVKNGLWDIKVEASFFLPACICSVIDRILSLV